MTESEELELNIFRFAEPAGNVGMREWRPTDLPMLSSSVKGFDRGVLIEALDDLHARKLMEFRQWSDQRKDWVLYPGKNPQYFRRMFEMHVTYSGRKYFERLEIESKAPGRPTLPQKPDSQTAEGSAASPKKAKAPKAFVSHSTQDHPFVEKFAADLRAKGVDAWFSKWEIKPGDSIRAKIDEGLEGCEYFIIVLSRTSVNRPWVRTELDAATIRKLGGKVRKIIPVKIEDCGDLPPTLASLCWEDFSNQPYEAALKRVLDSIFEVDVRPPLGQPPIGSVSKPDTPTAQYPEILAADWGIGEPNYKDKRELLVGYLEARTPELRASNRYFRDEYPHEPKHLRVRYRWADSNADQDPDIHRK